MDYRSTLNLPSTKFPMRANLAQREPEILKTWEKSNIYHKIREARKDKETFVLHDGPPYANGDIHLGTGLNKLLKDLVIKSRLLLGQNIHYRPGWDCHGLPIELNITQSLSEEEANTLHPNQIRNKCFSFAKKFVNKHRKSFKRLGIIGDWERPYLTLNPEYEAEELRQFANLVKEGYVYQGLKPVYWSTVFKTALAEAEVEYEEHTTPAIYVRLPLTAESTAKLKDQMGDLDDKPINSVIWTTTPWTLPANRAVCLHPNYMYGLVPLENEYILVAKELVDRFLEETGLQRTGDVIGGMSGTELCDLKIEMTPPFSDKPVPTIIGQHVTLEQGTGAVHTAPGHGHDDYMVGMKYNLEVFSPVDDSGCFTSESPICEGVFVEKANKPIIENLQERGLLVHQDKLVHSYPHCWRSKKPIIFRATQQWFISLEKQNLRERLLDVIDTKVNWVPSWGRQRIRGMVENRQEWCISRQRSWGVPIPALYIDGAEQGLLDAEFINQLAKLVETEGTNIWFRAIDDPEVLKDLPRIHELLPEGKTLKDVKLEPDILDVWFDSGISHHSVMANEEKIYPVDLYLEGSDQHRGWFQSSLVTAIGAGYEPPYKTVLTHGFTVDENGKKLSKSLGNYVILDELVKKTGADVIRLWVASEDFRGDVTFSDEILSRIMESYRRLRNTTRFLLGNLFDFDLAQSVPEEERLELDRWILGRWRACRSRILNSYEKYEFHRIYYDLNNFCSVDLSAMYLDIIKDRLYVSGTDSHDRKSGQSTMAQIVTELTACIAPILSFTGEEIWSYIIDLKLVKDETVFLYEIEQQKPDADKTFVEKWEKIFLLRSEAIKAIEQARKASIIGHSLDSCVHLTADSDEWKSIIEECVNAQVGDDLASILIVSDVKVGTLPEGVEAYKTPLLPGIKIAVTKADGEKCPRCWHYHPEVVLGEEEKTCPRCQKILDA